MIQIFLDGRLAVPSSKASIKLTSENPYFTKSASYTYEVELPTDIPQNRAIFGNIDRIDTDKETRTYSCRLDVDNVTVLTGTAHLTSVTESSVRIQMLGAEAAFNYGNKMEGTYVDELDLGDWFHRTWPDGRYYDAKQGRWLTLPENLSDSPFAVDYIIYKTRNEREDEPVYANQTVDGCRRQFSNLTSGKYPWLMIPVENVNYDRLCNRIAFYETAPGSDTFVRDAMPGYKANHLFGQFLQLACIQPFLWKMAELVAEASGFSLAQEDNTLFTDPFLKRVFVVNANNFIECNKCLPHWTVNEWWTQLEQTFGLVMTVDYTSGTMALRHRADHYAHGATVCHVDRVVDQFNTEIDDDTQADVAVDNVGFTDFDADPYDILTEYITTKAEYDDRFADYTALLEWGQGKGTEWLEENAKDVIFRTGDGRRFIYMRDLRPVPDQENIPALVEPGFREVDQFRPRYANVEKKDIDIELKFVPARWTDAEMEIYRYSSPRLGRGDFAKIKVSVLSVDGTSVMAPGFSGEEEYVTKIDIEDLIKGQESEQESPTESQDLVYIALAPEGTGVGHTFAEFRAGEKTYVEIPLYRPLTRERVNLYINGGASITQRGVSLSLNPIPGLVNLASSTLGDGVSVATKSRMCIRFLSDTLPDPKALFIIRNRRFVCEKIEADISQDGISPLYTGYFFPVDIKD